MKNKNVVIEEEEGSYYRGKKRETITEAIKRMLLHGEEEGSYYRGSKRDVVTRGRRGMLL